MRLIFCVLAVVGISASANDYVPANLQWSLNNDPQVTFDNLSSAIEQNCAQLKSNPPTVNNIATSVINCGQISGTSAISKRVNVAYTLRLATSSLQSDKQIKSNFSLTHKVACATPGFAHLQAEPAAAFKYTCWRCPQTERKAKQPKFIEGGNVRWFSASHCPLDLTEQQIGVKASSDTQADYVPQALPPVLSLPREDSVALHIEKQAQQGVVVALIFNDGQRKLFIGERNSQSLVSAQKSWGSLQRKADNWLWLTSQGTRYQFESRADDYLHIESKRLANGESWQFHWLRLPIQRDGIAQSEMVARLDWVIDQNQQRYSFSYNEKGEVSRVKIEGRQAYETPSISLLAKPALPFKPFMWHSS